MSTELKNSIFKVETIQIEDRSEQIVRGGRDRFHLLPIAFEGIELIGVIGWGPQARAQALNLRDSLRGTDCIVKVGLRRNSKSIAKANAEGFLEENGTLGEMMEVIGESDMVLLLIADSAQAALFSSICTSLKPGATLGLSHGFLIGYLESFQLALPTNINVIGVCPKGMGDSVRRSYLQGENSEGAGINTSIVVYQDIDNRATDRALGWAIGIGAPYCFQTTFEQEYVSDLFGERAILLGAVYGITESLYDYFRRNGMSENDAFSSSAGTISGAIAPVISSYGIANVYESLGEEGKLVFAQAFTTAHSPFMRLLHEMYDEIKSGNEIKSIILAGERLKESPMPPIGQTGIWKDNGVTNDRIKVHPFTAGIYCAAMIAQVDILMEKGHSYSEIANESIIEAVDSLIPYMHKKGIAYMIDNCSISARLGARKWGPHFDYALRNEVYDKMDGTTECEQSIMEHFKNHMIHGILDDVKKLRPSVPVAV